ncbi:aldo/keto reductase [Sorangium cellulosum]|uniref:Aldo/keto reductase n=1 Tax=Sorangium cellulosum TaxID=56 RepID=A0A2L0F456_SORCE|nr:aldo/keto reductase [Sorangium cellulosum]
MPLDHYITLGRSGLRVSPFCLGAMTFGEELGWGASVETSNAILDRFIERGGNFIDTANAYTRGHSEKIIGDHIGRHPSRRDRVVIATKFLSNLYPGDPNGGGAGRKSLIAACEQSLRRLQTDYIDLYWMHCWDRFTPIDETMAALDDLVRSGKVRYIGFSDTPAWKVVEAQLTARFRGWQPLIALQIEYSLLERTVEGELIPMALEMGLGVTPWSPLKSGALSGKYTRENAGKVKADRGAWVESALGERTYTIVDKLIAIAKELETTPARVALAWVQGRPGVSSTILGARSLQQLDDNLAALDVKLRPEHVAALDEVSRPTLNFPADFLKMAGVFTHGGSVVNGEDSPVWPMAPRNDSERY